MKKSDAEKFMTTQNSAFKRKTAHKINDILSVVIENTVKEQSDHKPSTGVKNIILN